MKRYVGEKVRYIREHCPADEHILIIPGEQDACVEEEQSRVYTIRSPLISRTSRYRVLLRLEAIERILERERPQLIESGDPYQVAWKAVHSGAALGIPIGIALARIIYAWVTTQAGGGQDVPIPVDWAMIVTLVLLGSLLVAVVSSALPARRAVALQVAEALRHE